MALKMRGRRDAPLHQLTPVRARLQGLRELVLNERLKKFLCRKVRLIFFEERRSKNCSAAAIVSDWNLEQLLAK